MDLSLHLGQLAPKATGILGKSKILPSLVLSLPRMFLICDHSTLIEKAFRELLCFLNNRDICF